VGKSWVVTSKGQKVVICKFKGKPFIPRVVKKESHLRGWDPTVWGILWWKWCKRKGPGIFCVLFKGRKKTKKKGWRGVGKWRGQSRFISLIVRVGGARWSLTM